MLLILRCVDPRDKAMALGLIQFAIGLFGELLIAISINQRCANLFISQFFFIGNVPCPIVYGAVVDTACLVWEYACGERGACWLYDSNVFRMFLHGQWKSCSKFSTRCMKYLRNSEKVSIYKNNNDLLSSFRHNERDFRSGIHRRPYSLVQGWQYKFRR